MTHYSAFLWLTNWASMDGRAPLRTGSQIHATGVLADNSGRRRPERWPTAGRRPTVSLMWLRRRISIPTTQLVLVALFGLSLTATSVLTTVPAGAAPSTTSTPILSGLDAVDYAGEIGARGTVIRQVPLDPSVSLPAAGRAYRVLYATRDIHDRPAVSTGAVFLPKQTAPPGGYPVLAWAHGTTGLGDQCAPSVRPRSPRDKIFLDHWLNRGYAIVSTDYAGLGTPGLMNYLSGVVEANSIGDSVAAASAMGLPLSKKWAIIGQSQGAGAALNAATRATALSAAHGLQYRGVVAMGTPANIEHVVTLGVPAPVVLPSGMNAYTAYIFAALADVRPDLKPLDVLTPRGRTLVRQARTMCLTDLERITTGMPLTEFFAKPVLTIPGIRETLVEYMATPYRGYDRPVFLAQGLLDLDVPAPSALTLYAQMRAARQPVELHVYPDKEHSTTVIAALKDVTPFVARILG